MMRVFLIRHAQSENNILNGDSLHLRKVDPALTPLGHQQRAHLSQFAQEQRVQADAEFQITHLYTSAMYRSLLTAQPLGAALGLQPQVWPDLHESGGMYQRQNGSVIGYTGMTRSAILQEFPDYVLPESVSERGWYDAALGIEPESHTRYRATRVAEGLNKRGASDDVLALVSHADFLDFVLQALIDQLPTNRGIGRFYHHNTAITRIDYAGSQPALHFLNRVDHLPAAMHTF